MNKSINQNVSFPSEREIEKTAERINMGLLSSCILYLVWSQARHSV